MIELYDWQKEAHSKIRGVLNGCVIEAVTGSGKTVVGLKMIEDNPTKKILVVVPTIVLQDQWKQEMIKFGVATEDEITFLGGAGNPDPSKRIMVAVVNSLRRVNWNSPQATFDICILDEVHRYASPENIRFLREGKFGFILGITATLERSDGREELLTKYIGPVVYRLNNADATRLGYICQYEVIMKECHMDDGEKMRYVSLDYEVKSGLAKFNNNLNTITDIIKQGYRHSLFRTALEAMSAIQQRLAHLAAVKDRKVKAIEIVKKHVASGEKIILFDEIQESANKIYEEMRAQGIGCVLYHSGIKGKEKKESIKKFTDGEVKVMVSVKALDEGLDVKDVSVGIVVNGNSQRRQALQRLGRLLRKREGKLAKFYIIYVPKTSDEGKAYKRAEHLGMGQGTMDDDSGAINSFSGVDMS